MRKDMFRKSALDKISSLDNLDQLMQVVKPSNVLTLLSIGIVLAVIVAWCFLGAIPETVYGTGVLVDTSHLMSVKYSSQGTVKNIFVKQDDIVRSGQIIARIEHKDLLDRIKALTGKLENLQQIQRLINESRQKNKTRQQQMQELYDLGLVTESEYLNTNQTSLSYEGQILEVRQEIALLNENYKQLSQVTASYSGRILEVPVRKGDYLSPGSIIAIIQSQEGDTVMEAVTYFPVQEGKKILPGMTMALVPSTVKQEEYGYIQGIITEVSEFPVSPNHLATTLQNQALVSTFQQQGALLEVKVSIIPDPNTASGYKWSSSRGPDQKIGSGFVCSAFVTTATKKPVELIVPAIKRTFLGIGEQQNIGQSR